MANQKLTDSEEDTRNFLINLPLFDSFNVDELDVLAKHMSYVHLKRGEYLFVEGDKGNFMGFVVHGVLEVSKKSETGGNIVIARLTVTVPHKSGKISVFRVTLSSKFQVDNCSTQSIISWR